MVEIGNLRRSPSMRARVLICLLLLFAVFGTGCAVDMSSKKEPGRDKVIEHIAEPQGQFGPVSTVVGTTGGDRETAYVLIRHTDGQYYVINMNTGRAKKVSGIKSPCN
jgi:hypothetical protein